MKKINIPKKLLIKEYIKNEKSIYQIAKILKCGHWVIYIRLIEYSIPRRTIKEACKRMNEGSKNNNYIDGRRNKIYYCIDCGKEINWVTGFKGQGRCRSCALKFYCKNNPNFNRKENHPNFGKFGKNASNWINGLSREPYPLEFNESLKESIRHRDNHTCQKCGIHQEDYHRKLDVHHIDYDKDNLNPDNLITLCGRCNCKANKNRDYWFAYFKYIVKE